jgi:NADH-quinone oxidoreductase subunit C
VTEPEGAWRDSAEAKELKASTYARQFAPGKRVPAEPWAGIVEEHGSPDVDKLVEGLGEAVLRTGADGSGDPVVEADPEKIGDVLAFLRDERGFSMLTDVTAVDYPEEEKRFVVVYHLTRLDGGKVMRVKAFLPEEDPEIPSVVPHFDSANWLEREVWDMFGIRFRDHPDHRRILMPDDYPHHPLRKEFPVTGDIVMRD